MAQKWIINDDSFRMSASVEYHSELAKDHSTTQGGGFWHLDNDKKILYLWGVSSDFGYSDPEIVKKALEDGPISARFNGYTVMHSPLIGVNMPSVESFETLCIINPVSL